jgi:hypothetical protein
VTPAQLWAETLPGWLDGEPPGATGQPKLAPYPARVPGNRRTPPAVEATEGVRIPMRCTTRKSAYRRSGVTESALSTFRSQGDRASAP